MIRKNDYIGFEELIAESITLMNQLTALKKGELKRIQGQSGSTKVSMVYLNMVQEAQNVVSFTANLLKVSRKFRRNNQSLLYWDDGRRGMPRLYWFIGLASSFL